MPIFHDDVTIQHGGKMPSLGALIGSRVSSDVFAAVQGSSHSSYFGDDFNKLKRDFFNQFVKPMDNLSIDLSRTVNALMNPDRIRPLISIDDLRTTPLSMELSIALYEPVRTGILEGRMDGYGYDPSTLPKEDFYGRMIENFSCSDVREASDADGYFPLTGTMHSDDPDLSDDELRAIEATRDFIRDRILAETNRDPTSIDVCRG